MEGTYVEYMEEGETLTILNPAGEEVDLKYTGEKFIVTVESSSESNPE